MLPSKMNKRSTLPVLLILLISAAPAFALSGNECPNDETEFTNVQKRAAKGNPSAQTALAICYDVGGHVQPSRAENLRWLTAAASQDYAPAEYELGRTYLYGRGVPADYAKALLWERKAAEQGDPRAQRDLALIYERGFGVKADPLQAAFWNRKAATQGQPDAQLKLAQALEGADGITRDTTEARRLYAEAAKRNQPLAQLQLARIYSKDSDCRRSIHWYKEAAAGGEPAAMYELGKLYLSKTCGENRLLALQWLSIGARFGSRESKIAADKLRPGLSQKEQKYSASQAARWIAHHSGAQIEEDEKERDEH